MTINQYQQQASRTMNPDLSNGETIRHALYGMVSELGEIHSLYQKVFQGHDFDKEHLKSELGDLLWFIAEYCTAFDWDLDDVCSANIEKLKNRYPEGFNAEQSKTRKEGDI